MSGNKLSIRNGGGFLTWFGLLFFLPAIDIASKFLYAGRPITGADIFGGTLFTCIAIAMVFGRSGCTLDKDQRLITHWWGLTFWPMSVKTTELSQLSEVLLVEETRSNKDSSYTVRAVYLVSGNGKVEWKAPGSYLQARKIAEDLSRFTQRPMNDKVTGHRREPDELDLPLGERLRRQGEPIKLVSQPQDSAIVYRQESERVTFNAPQRWDWNNLGGLVGLLFLVGMFWDTQFIKTHLGEKGLNSLIAGIILASLVFVAWQVKSSLGGRIEVTLTPRSLKSEMVGKLSSKKEIELTKLEELDVVDDGAAWEARSDDRVIRFSGRLRADEIYWMRDTLEHFVHKFYKKVVV